MSSTKRKPKNSNASTNTNYGASLHTEKREEIADLVESIREQMASLMDLQHNWPIKSTDSGREVLPVPFVYSNFIFVPLPIGSVNVEWVNGKWLVEGSSVIPDVTENVTSEEEEKEKQ
jgi:hypothetical protein